ncbi:MAG: glycosyltransferase [Azoarcus sp.]|nr:glycosyltransferase [Azoarcus sp.]
MAEPTPPGDCILFATADWDAPYWTNKQHIANELARMGWRVLYVESPGIRAPSITDRRNWPRLWRRLKIGLSNLYSGARKRRENLWVLSPLSIPAKHHRPIANWLNRCLLQSMMQRFIQTKGFTKPLIWTYHPFMLEAIAPLKRSALLYHCVDDLAAVPGVNARAFRAAEQKLLQAAQTVFTTSKSLAEHCAKHNPHTHFLPNVADAIHFGRALGPGPIPADMAEIPEPRLIYHGVLSDFKVDFALLHKAAQLRPDWHWILIGEEREGQKNEDLARLSALPNVHRLGYRPYDALPNYLRGAQVGLLPTLLNDYTRSMFPMKYFEYLAAGLPIVSTKLAFTKTHCAGLEIAQTPEEIIHAVEKQIHRGKYSPEETSAHIADNTWLTRTKNMLEKL